MTKHPRTQLPKKFRMKKNTNEQAARSSAVGYFPLPWVVGYLGIWVFGCLAICVFLFMATQSTAQEPSESSPNEGIIREARDIQELFEQGVEMIELKQHERGLDLLNSVVREAQGSILAHRANMAMGSYFLSQGKPGDALNYFMLLTRVLAPVPGEEQPEERAELYREALFQAGLSRFQAGQYAAAFPLFRRLLEVADKSQWADLAYYYIGMGHNKLQNWSKSLDALSLVGTEAEDEVDEMGRIEIGQHFYTKITDADFPVMREQGEPIRATVTVSSGDVEILQSVLVGGKDDEVLVSAPTELGLPAPNDGKLQLLGGDTLTVTYIDQSTQDGKKDVSRSGSVRTVSTGAIGFFLGDYETPAYLAFPGQPQAIVLRDADLDTSPNAERVSVTVRSLYKVEVPAPTPDSAAMLDIFADKDVAEEDKWRERDRITVALIERGEGELIRSGAFIGAAQLATVEAGVKPSLKDQVLHCDELDELSVTYTDAVHIYGQDPRETEARLKVSGSVNAGVTADQFVVFESLLKARKGSVEAEALVQLGEIYKEMGLEERAMQQAGEALSKVNPVIMDRAQLPGDIVEGAFKLKWEAELLQDDFNGATATCLAFNKLYPESILADQALMTVGRSLAQKGQYQEAVLFYGQVLKLQNPISAAEAQFRIGETWQKRAEESADAAAVAGSSVQTDKTTLLQRMGEAMAAYRKCFQAYPDSSYAAEALRLLVRHYVETKDFSQAETLLENVFVQYPDAAFLDEMLMVWAEVAYRLDDAEMSMNKLRQMIYDYPQSGLISDARQKLGALEARTQ